MIGPQVSSSQLEKIEGYVKIGRDEGAEVLIGGQRPGAERRALLVAITSSRRC